MAHTHSARYTRRSRQPWLSAIAAYMFRPPLDLHISFATFQWLLSSVHGTVSNGICNIGKALMVAAAFKVFTLT